MNHQTIQSIVEEVMKRLSGESSREAAVPLAVSARHCHLSQEDLEQLFGKGYEITKKADLSQPGQFAANETIVIAGPRGSIEKVRILGPARQLTQVEVSQTDAVKLGLKPPLRESGNIQNSSPVTLIGPKGSLYKKEGLIIAQAHIHMTPEDAASFHVENGEFVKVKVQSERPLTFEKVLVRVSPRYRLEMHIDTDEANAGFILKGNYGKLIKWGEEDTDKQLQSPLIQNEEQTVKSISAIFQNKLLTEHDVKSWPSNEILVGKKTIVTPLARDAASQLGKSIIVSKKEAGEQI